MGVDQQPRRTRHPAATDDLSGFAGQTVRIRVEAADGGTAGLVEAGVDDVRITSG